MSVHVLRFSGKFWTVEAANSLNNRPPNFTDFRLLVEGKDIIFEVFLVNKLCQQVELFDNFRPKLERKFSQGFLFRLKKK